MRQNARRPRHAAPLNDARPHQATSEEAPNIDAIIGRQIKKRRLELGLTQTQLGKKVGLSFQQIQKYEWGSNRVSAPMLYGLASAIGVPIDYFFDSLPSTAIFDRPGDDQRAIKSPENTTPEDDELIRSTLRRLSPETIDTILAVAKILDKQRP